MGPRWGHGHGPGGGRAKRGDVRAAVLALLAERPMHGYEIIRELGERSHGVWQPSPGSVYPTLQMLEDQGFVRGIEDGGKRRYEITEPGRAHLADNPRHAAPWEEVARGADPVRMQLRDAAKHVMLATHQVAEVGTDSQRDEAVRLLVEARRKLYVLLATDTDAEAETGDDPGSGVSSANRGVGGSEDADSTPPKGTSSV
jgi:DNA-binding PadR family transcriptional regulator